MRELRVDVRVAADLHGAHALHDEPRLEILRPLQPGGAEQYSVVRASLHHRFITPFMDQLFHMGPDLPAIVNAYVIVKNEPWI